jgi:glycosyltransferase involved in cell wall biosynthesis
MKLTLITDAWTPQVNGVVRTLTTTIKILEQKGWQIQVIHPGLFFSVPFPPLPEIRIPVVIRGLEKMIRDFNPDYIHIATEARLGLAGRNFCAKNKLKYSTSYHTKFPEYAKAHYGIPMSWGYKYMRWVHNKSYSVMANTPSMKKLLSDKGFKNLAIWGRGVDTNIFKPYPKEHSFETPVFMYVGRLSEEKNIPAFLKLNLPGTKVVVGYGPMEDELKRNFPKAVFLGAKHGEELVKTYSQADVFVFPSRTDTFGLVSLEAVACGIPVAAYPVEGPKDILEGTNAGVLDNNLEFACLDALTLDPQDCVELARNNTWEKATEQFINNLIQAKK